MLLVDLDEVLADFVGAACGAHGLTREAFEAKRVGGVCGMELVMEITPIEFWAPINAMGEEFWVNLVPLPWMDDLVNLLEDHVGNWWIATTPSNELSSYLGKLKWINDYLPNMLHRTWPTQHKYLLGKEGRYLLDDRQLTLDKFESEGGKGILFPSRGNTLHKHADDPLPIVIEQLQRLDLFS